jgi:ferredoxin
MCEFCHQHGEGKKWYLQARNYSADLLSDVKRRRMIAEFFGGGPEELASQMDQLAKLHAAPPFVQAMMKRVVTRRMKKQHFGQVLPLEDIKEIFGFVDSITRVACICRQAKLGREARYCYGISLGRAANAFSEILGNVDSSFLSGPDTAGFETLTPEEATQAFLEHEREGCCHTVWTFVTPFIGGLCNCDRADCLAMQSTVVHDVKVMFRAEYVAAANPDACTGCRACMKVCQFGALGYSAADKKAYVDQRACYGCGICRAACSKGALRLVPRAEVPAVAGVW